MHLILAYIKFLLRSTNEHGVHSPFVYNLVTKCFYDKKKYQSYPVLKQYRQSLLKDKRKIKVSDFGAGSRVFRSEERRISKIAKSAGISLKRARLLNRLVRYLEVENALELGTSVGLATAAMAIENKVQITTMEGCPETARIAEENFQQFGLKNVVLKVGKFEEEILNSKFQIPNSNHFSEKQPATRNPQHIQDSKFQIPNSGFFKTNEFETDNRQPRTDNRQQETNSKSEIPNSNLSWNDNPQEIQDLRFKIQNSGFSKTNELGIHNRPPITDNPEEIQNSKFKIQNSGFSKTNEFETDNRQPITDNPQQETNSKSEIPNSNHFSEKQPATRNKFKIQNSKFKIQTRPETDNRELTTHNSQQKTNSKSQIPNSNHFSEKQPATRNSQPATGNPQLTTPNSELLTHHFDLLYIDGNHQKKATLAYFEQLLPKVHNDSVMIFDDIHWSRGMEEAWEEIKQHPSVRVSIDTFQWGLVFFRKEQEKEHFVIRV